MQNKRVRKPVPRLKEFDYAKPGFYHVVLCVIKGHHILSKVVPDESRGRSLVGPHARNTLQPQMKLYDAGNVIEANIQYINNCLSSIRIDEYIIMPNHLHMIIELDKDGYSRADQRSAPTSLIKVVQSFKSSVTKQAGFKFWQRGYYERVIRDEQELCATKQYIKDNPKNWEQDFYFVQK